MNMFSSRMRVENFLSACKIDEWRISWTSLYASRQGRSVTGRAAVRLQKLKYFPRIVVPFD